MPKGWFTVSGRHDLHYFVGPDGQEAPLCKQPGARSIGRRVLGPEQDKGRDDNPQCKECFDALTADIRGSG